MIDFETSTEEWLKIDRCARVWAGCIATIEEQPKVVTIVNNIDDFMKELIKLGNIECFAHNLKFDGEYLLAWMFSNGYKYDESGQQEKSFKTCISDTGLWYYIQITHKVYNKRYVRTMIYDSLKKLPMKVSEIAKAFKLEESKGSIDYDKYRPVGYELTDEEREYITNDCVIVAKALYLQFTKGLDKMTIGSDALTNFKNDVGLRAFKYLYPVVSLSVDNDFRKAYKGGFVMVNPHFQNQELSGISFDVNSLYPSVMYGNMGLLPYGVPKMFKGKYKKDEGYPLYIQKLSCSFKIKPNKIPTIQMKGNLSFIPTEYITDSKGIVDLTLTSVDLELLFEHYDVENIEYYGGYKFKGTDTIFKGYIDYWSKIKAESEGGTRQLAKLMLNSLYGKFATNPKKQSKIPRKIDGEIKLVLSEPTFDDPVYTALGAFITARARAYTITNSQRLYEHWVYSDTDSIYLTGITLDEVKQYIDVHPTKLGAWKCEHIISRAKFLRPKTYIMQAREMKKDGTLTDEELSITCAGMPDNIKNDIIAMGTDEAFKMFDYKSSFAGKLQPQRVKGGVVLIKRDFTIQALK